MKSDLEEFVKFFDGFTEDFSIIHGEFESVICLKDFRDQEREIVFSFDLEGRFLGYTTI